MNEQEVIYGCTHCHVHLFACKVPMRAITMSEHLCMACYGQLRDYAWRYQELCNEKLKEFD